MEQLLARHRDVVVSGTVENQVRFYDRFEHIVLLSAPLEVLTQRVQGSDEQSVRQVPDRSRSRSHGYVRTIEPLLRQRATVELDGRRARRRAR